MNGEKCFLLPLKAQVKANKQINVAMSYIEGKRRYLYIYIYIYIYHGTK